MSRLTLALALLSGLSVAGHHLASRPPAWLHADPLRSPFGVLPDGDGQFDTTGAEEWSQERTPAVTLPLNINRSSAAELIALPGVGPVLAARIVAHRDSLGDFGSLEELDAVRGIGPASLIRLRPHLLFEANESGAAATAQPLQNATESRGSSAYEAPAVRTEKARKRGHG